jgi:uncharacterized delta-60 repeat protein
MRDQRSGARRIARAIAATVLVGAMRAYGTACPDGYFEIQGQPLFTSEEPLAVADAIGTRDGVSGVLSGCPAQFVKKRPATRVLSLRWDRGECLSTRRLQLRARFSRDCTTLAATLTEKPRGAIGRRKFTALRTTPPASGADPTFGIGGTGGTPFEVPLEPFSIAALDDGGVLIVGYLRDTPAAGIVRLGRDGQLDPTFGDGGLARYDGAFFGDVLVEPDGRAVVVGQIAGAFAITRYTASGTIDPSFGDGGITVAPPVVDGRMFAVARDPSGGFVLAGSRRCSQSFRGCAQLLRVDADGHPDPTFGTDGYVIVPPLLPEPSDAALAFTAITVEADRSVLVAGTGYNCPTADPFPAIGCQVVARFHADGTPDATFGTNGLAADVLPQPDPNVPSRIMRDANGNVLVLGGLREWYYVRIEHGLTRYAPSGMLDTGFGVGGVQALPPFTDVVPRSGGGYVAAVASVGFSGASILRLTGAWEPDPTFGTNGSLSIGEIARFFTMAGHPDGRISIAAQLNGNVYRRLP